MAVLDEATIKAIRKKHPIKEIVERYNVSLVKKGEDDYLCKCPFHMSVLGKEDRNDSMSLSGKLDIFKCFSCGTSGNIFKFISLMENISYGEAVHLLAQEDGYEVGAFTKVEDPHTKDYEIMNSALKFYQNNINSVIGVNAIKYLENRAIDRETIKKFDIGLSTFNQSLTKFLLNKYTLKQLVDLGLSNMDEKDIFNDRIMIPIHDLNGNPIGFGGRIYQSKDNSKYINSKATDIFDKSKILYNYHRAHKKMTKDDSIIIMEGYFDVIRASTIGINNCVAPMGTALTKQHIQILKKITNNIILCFDGDDAGKNATIKTIPLLEEAGMNVKVIRLEEKDPDEFIIKRGKDAFIEKIAHPLSALDFKLQMLIDGKNLNDVKDVSLYLDEAVKLLVNVEDNFIVELTLKELANKFDMEYKSLEERFLKYKSNNNYMANSNNSLVKKNKKIPNKYGQATDNLLYYMTVSGEVIELALNKVIKIIDDKKRRLFFEIISYYHKYGNIIKADFATYLELKTDVADTFYEIITNKLKEEYTIEEIEDYIKCINDCYKKSRIDKLKLELTKEMNPMKQANILNEIMKIRGVKTSD